MTAPRTARKRSRASARKAGPAFERLIADYLAAYVDDRIDRRVKTGAKDKGDIANLRTEHGARLVGECKDSVTMALAAWLTEAEVERINDAALAGVVFHKARGIAAPGRQRVSMEVRDLVAILTGVRPPDHLPDPILPGLDKPEPVSTSVDTPPQPRRAFTAGLIPSPDEIEHLHAPDGLTPPGYTPTLTGQD